jgi:hypothetical protein
MQCVMVYVHLQFMFCVNRNSNFHCCTVHSFYMQIFHQHNLLINEQNISDINPLYEFADTSQIPLQKNAPYPPSMNSQTHNESHHKKTHPNSVPFCTAHNTHITLKVNLSHLYLSIYLFICVLYLLFMFFHIYNFKNTFYCRHAATAPHNLTKYNVTLTRLHTISLRMVEDRNM